jgi:hypothetical protein
VRLAIILAGGANSGSKKDKEIDHLYKTILGGVLQDEILETEINLIKVVLWMVACVRVPVTRSTLAAFLKVNGEQVWAALQPLQSVLHVSKESGMASTLHGSFSDLMLNLGHS